MPLQTAAHMTGKDYRNVMRLLEKTAADSRKWDPAGLPPSPPGVLISFLNAHAVNQAASDPLFAGILLHSDLLLRDGIGVRMAMRALRLPETPNLNGTDLIPRILSHYKNTRLAIFGTSDAALAACGRRLTSEGFPVPELLRNGFLTENDYLQALVQTPVEIVVLCMGMPRQELIAEKIRQGGFTGMIVCGGGWADFYSGTKARAPEWMRRMSIEWLHRLLLEPRRLGRRYTIDILSFFITTLRTARIRSA